AYAACLDFLPWPRLCFSTSMRSTTFAGRFLPPPLSTTSSWRALFFSISFNIPSADIQLSFRFLDALGNRKDNVGIVRIGFSDRQIQHLNSALFLHDVQREQDVALNFAKVLVVGIGRLGHRAIFRSRLYFLDMVARVECDLHRDAGQRSSHRKCDGCRAVLLCYLRTRSCAFGGLERAVRSAP